MSGSDSSLSSTGDQSSFGSKIFLGTVGTFGATGGAIGVGTAMAGAEGTAAAVTEGGLLEAVIAGHEIVGSGLIGTTLGSGGGVVIGGGVLLLYEMSKLPQVPGYGAPVGPNGSPVVISPY